MVFDFGSWQRFPKPLGISWVIGASFVLMRWLLVGSWIASGWRLGHQKDQPMIRSLEISVPIPSSREKRGAGDWVYNQLCLHDEASIEIYMVQRASRLVKTFMCWEGDIPQLHRDRSSCSQGPSGPLHLSLHLYPLSYPLLCNKQVNISVLLSSVSSYSKLLNLRRGSWELFICGQVRQTCG